MTATVERRAFVIMPFSHTDTITEEEWTDTFELVFKPAVEACGYACERAEHHSGNLIETLIRDLAYSRLVIADLTERNANVFYELGVRHAISKRTIMVTRDSKYVPSDLKGQWALEYGTSPRKVELFKQDIKKLINKIDNDPDINDSPVSAFLDQERFGLHRFVAKGNIKRLSALVTELSALLNVLDKVKEHADYRLILEYDCLDYLLRELYVDIGVQLLQDLHELRHGLKIIRSGLKLDASFINGVRNGAKAAFNAMRDLQQKLIAGNFVEPPNISSMIWTPLSDPSGGHISRADDISSISPEELRRRFEGTE
jgi:hypothetical protein